MKNIINYFKESFRRKKARRYFSEYPTYKDVFNLEKEGVVEFYNWDNPLVPPTILTQTEVDFFKKFIQPGSLAIDIGTNVGDTTVPIALAAGVNGLVVGFDPNPHVFKIAEQNATLNKSKTNIKVHPYAITEEAGEFYYASSEASFGNGGISADDPGKHGKFRLQQKIQGVNLEKFLTEHYSEWVDKISFIKIDTEGHDKEIIRSISPFLEKYKPVVIAECFTFPDPEDRRDLYRSITNLGYDVFYFSEFEADAEIRPIRSANEMADIKGLYNFYAIKK